MALTNNLNFRITSGNKKGLLLNYPNTTDTRPTTDRVKQAIFNLLPFGFKANSALDMFAGSGALGIECLSRGAKAAMFIDSSKTAADCITVNLKKADYLDVSKVIHGNFSTVNFDTTFDIIFLDPPYNKGLMQPALNLSASLLNPGGIIVCKYDDSLPLPDFSAFNVLKTKKYGITTITLIENY
ncbi:MAG: 16S rRNA (guanine(966)-N(2))-methyltransferase RsmD [Clostridiales bacterium]|jgi:16S rRNA (guanine(966)-N(2))-methyltransferase RsmD|nr:16S rRNA (guanine(966)-N(2))-methyltransferase RsmD [Clostridiales bacterium]